MRWLPGVLGLFLVACADTEPALGARDRAPCPRRCRALGGLGDCDVRAQDCQERIFDAVRCVRGTYGELPEIRIVSEDELREEGAQDAGDEEDAGSEAGEADDGREEDAARGEQDAGALIEQDAAGEAESEADDAGSGLTLLERWDVALGLFGLVTPESRQDDVDDVAGNYRSDVGVTLVDHGQPRDSAGSQTTLAHEFVHALQDQQVGLREIRAAASDRHQVLLERYVS